MGPISFETIDLDQIHASELRSFFVHFAAFHQFWFAMGVVRLLLINPKYPESFWSFRWALDEVLEGKRALNPPLGLATLAALCPPNWQVTLVDENVESVPLTPSVDIVGVCGMGVQFERQQELLKYYRSRGHFVVAGGSFASLCPERYGDFADTVIAGEAEYIWKCFCADFEHGSPLNLYREIGTVKLEDSPTPRFDLLKLGRYTSATLQFSRGCPYRCEFCDIIVMFGRKPRYKTLDQIERELDSLRELGARSVFFVDDNLIGHRAAARELLLFLRYYQLRNGAPFRFGTEASLNLAQDTEMLELFQEAGFSWVFVGIESPDPDTLKATLKTQNLRADILTSVNRIHAHGIEVLAGFIVGFDQDTQNTFEHQYRFIMTSGIQAAMVGLLTALPHTPLHDRLKRENRLIEDDRPLDNTRPRTNVVPKTMTQSQLIDGYERLYHQLLDDRGIGGRVRAKLRQFGRPLYGTEYSIRQAVRIAVRLFVRGVVPGGPKRIFHFFLSLPWSRPQRLPIAMSDWITGLAMRDYVKRRFGNQGGEDPLALRAISALRQLIARHGGIKNVDITLEGSTRLSLSFLLRDVSDARLLARIGACVERLLRSTRLEVTLRFKEAQATQLVALNRFVQRLARYGDRVAVELNERLRGRIVVDSSVFRLIL